MRIRNDTAVSPESLPVNRPHKLPLATMFGNRDETLERDSKLINCFVEKDLMTGEYWVEKRVGTALSQTLSGEGQGIYNWDGVLYSIFGGSVYKDSVLFGVVDGTNGKYRFVQLLGTPPRLCFCNGTHLYYTDGITISEVEKYSLTQAGSFQYDIQTPGVHSAYTITSVGTSDFTDFGVPYSAVIHTSDGFLSVGTKYIILSTADPVGSRPTDWTLMGAPNNTPGTAFVATYTGTHDANGKSNGHGYVSVACAGTVGTSFIAYSPGEGTGTAALLAPYMIVGQDYIINTVGTTDFTLCGAPANTVGLQFTCTAKATAYTTGTVKAPNFPAQDLTKGIVYLDGTLYVMDTDANIWGSKEFDNPVVWDPLNKIVARIEPDKGVTMAKHLGYVIAMKQWTLEVFYDAGNPTGSPLANMLGAKQPYGCLSADSVQELDDVLYWATSNRSTSPQIAMMQNLKLEIISTPAIERLLDQVDFSAVHSFTLKHGGHKFYILTLVNANLTLVFDITQGFWYTWTDYKGDYWPYVDRAFNAQKKHVLQGETDGKLYLTEGDYEYPNDAGVLFPVDIYTSNTTFNIDRRKVLKVMRFNADQKDGSKLQVRVSDDDYQTWSNFREVNLAQKRPTLIDCGTFYRRAWHIRHYANTPLRIKSVELQMDVGTL